MGDLLSAVGLLLTVLTALYGFWSTEFTRLGTIKTKVNQSNHQADLADLRSAFKRAVPLALYAVGLAAIAGPPAWEAVASVFRYASDPAFRANAPYNAVRAALVMVELGLIALAVLVSSATWKMCSVYRAIQKLPP